MCAGPRDGRLVVLLHGFPELWYGWRRSIAPLARAGFRVLAPDQRGYADSDKPKGIGAYEIDELARDLIGLIDASSRERAIVVGHDWGGAVAWWAAMTHSERIEKLAVVNVPHPLAMAERIKRLGPQLRRSWYMLFFQLPLLPERSIRSDGGLRFFEAMRRNALPGAFTDADRDTYLEAWNKPRALESMLAWYRAAPRMLSRPPSSQRIDAPTLIVWGRKDRFLGWEMIMDSVAYCENARVRIFDHATHFAQHEEPERVNELFLEFFTDRRA